MTDPKRSDTLVAGEASSRSLCSKRVFLRISIRPTSSPTATCQWCLNADPFRHLTGGGQINRVRIANDVLIGQRNSTVTGGLFKDFRGGLAIFPILAIAAHVQQGDNAEWVVPAVSNPRPTNYHWCQSVRRQSFAFPPKSPYFCCCSQFANPAATC
jgi:hypothetical protein